MYGRRVLALMGFLTFLVVPAGPAAATSCAGWPDDVTQQVLQGRLPDLVGASGASEAFTDRYDFAVIGTVRSVGSVNSSPVPVEVDVAAALFRPVGPALTLQMSDAGAMLGYPFQVGHTYLIPVQESGLDGLRNTVMICDPVAEVAPGDVAEHVATARAAGTLATPASVASAASTDVPTRASTGVQWAWPAIGAGGVVLATGLIMLRSRRRREPGTR